MVVNLRVSMERWRFAWRKSLFSLLFNIRTAIDTRSWVPTATHTPGGCSIKCPHAMCVYRGMRLGRGGTECVRYNRSGILSTSLSPSKECSFDVESDVDTTLVCLPTIPCCGMVSVSSGIGPGHVHFQWGNNVSRSSTCVHQFMRCRVGVAHSAVVHRNH